MGTSGMGPHRRRAWTRSCIAKLECPLAFILLAFMASARGTQDFPSLSVIQPSTSTHTQASTVQGLVSRIVGDRASQFNITVNTTLGRKDRDTFMLSSHGGVVSIQGTSGVATAWGFYYYLSQYCGAHVSWTGRQVYLPSPLPPLPPAGVQVTSNDKFRYYMNVCTMSYSFAWADWGTWERQIDWMALHAINLPLAFVGQEAIWQKVYLRMGFLQSELDAHFAGPAFLAWGRMGNMHGWGGPLPQSWHRQQVALQHKILQRMRDFGMTPVLPAFAGYVPESITRMFPNVKIHKGGDWGHFNQTYCCNTLLDFNDPLFVEIGYKFINEYTKEFGTNHVYSCDTFNENTPQFVNASYLKDAGAQVFKAMTAADRFSIWLMQGWLFNSGFWSAQRAQALLTAVPKGRMIVLDMPAELAPQYARLQSFYGQPFIWTMVHNYGGNLAMYGALHNVNKGPAEARSFINSSMVGTGLTMEGIYQNYVMYEFMMEHTWRKAPTNLTAWITQYHTKRYGKYNSHADRGWQLLKDTVYNCEDGIERHGHGRNLIVRRPNRRARIDWNMDPSLTYDDHGTDLVITQRPNCNVEQDVWYDPEMLYQAWDSILLAADDLGRSSLFRYDLVDVTRQSLQVIAIKHYADLMAQFKVRDLQKTRLAGNALVALLDNMERLLATDGHFLLGKWLEAAKAQGRTAKETRLYEYNARNQITLWGPTGQILDYANKQWSGMFKSYYSPRWQLMVDTLLDCINQSKPFNQRQFNKDVFLKVEQPFNLDRSVYPTEPKGDALSVVKDLHKLYRPFTTQHAKFFSKLPKWSKTPKGFGHQAINWLLGHQRRIVKNNKLFGDLVTLMEH